MTGPRIHAVVLNYRQQSEVVGCVDALRRGGMAPARILVVDNASPDGSGEALERWFGDVPVLRLEENRGYGAGNNAGIEWLWSAPAPVPDGVFILNPDVRVRSDTLDELASVLEGRTDLGGISCVQRDGTSPATLDGVFERWVRRRDIRDGELDRKRFVRTDSLLGAAMVLTREGLTRVGGFDPLYFMYAEEEDLARRLRFHGLEVGLACRAEVIHRRPYLSDDPTARDWLRRSSQYLYALKDPSHPIPFNLARVVGLMRSQLGLTLTREDRTVREWIEEIGWFIRRMPAGLQNRRQEMSGPAHLRLDEQGGASDHWGRPR